MSFLGSSYLDRLLGRARGGEAPPKLPLPVKEKPIHDVNTCHLQWNEADGSRASGYARIGCRAANGFVVWCESPILPGTEVSIFGSVPGRAAVTFCRTDAGRYLLILTPVTAERRRWDERLLPAWPS